MSFSYVTVRMLNPVQCFARVQTLFKSKKGEVLLLLRKSHMKAQAVFLADWPCRMQMRIVSANQNAVLHLGCLYSGCLKVVP